MTASANNTDLKLLYPHLVSTMCRLRSSYHVEMSGLNQHFVLMYIVLTRHVSDREEQPMYILIAVNMMNMIKYSKTKYKCCEEPRVRSLFLDTCRPSYV